MLKIYNTLTRQKEEFKPITAGKVGMYVCGVTIYDLCHIGHGRTFVSFDVVSRYLRYLGYDLTFVRNITDIDDKIIKRAAENGESCESLTERLIGDMHADFDALNMKLLTLSRAQLNLSQKSSNWLKSLSNVVSHTLQTMATSCLKWVSLTSTASFLSKILISFKLVLALISKQQNAAH